MTGPHTDTLAGAALRDLHPSWLPDLDVDLVSMARDRPLGRRWLADRLAGTGGLFGDVRVHSEALRPPRLPGWLFRPLPAGLDLTLGAHAHGALIKTAVARAQVTQLRTLLGADLYARVVNAPLASDQAGHVEALPDPEDPSLGDRLRRQGAVELHRVALGFHALAAERIERAFPRAWALARGRARLSERRARALISTTVDATKPEPALA